MLLMSSCLKQKTKSNGILEFNNPIEYGVNSFGSVNEDFYKTPKGKKYHKKTCRMVDNYSEKLETKAEVIKYGLQPCGICNPPKIQVFQGTYSSQDISVGTSIAVRCNGRTLKGTRCKRMTKIANGYCFQHGEQTE